MATRSVDISVRAQGLSDAVKQAERLDKLLSKIEGRSSAQGRSTGSRAADAALLSSGGATDTGLTRGTAGGLSRGDSRDFARQAQGLGGLVHVYATFAANVFAVSTAFNALSKAMDFTIMQKSADILSGQLGVSLNNTAKALRDVVDGGISARQALEMTNMGATAGLTTKQMKDLSIAAKGASLALGRDLEDAMNRVFKGAIKIEPELLDELGIMVKVNDVNKEYARTLNKSAEALTDFERRQAFVNAVAAQGKDKYSELTQQVNPYAKLLASLNDIMMSTGGALNTVLGPIANFLASNTAALAGLLTLIGSALMGMAVPAIKAYSAAWKKQAEETTASLQTQISAIEAKKKALIDAGTQQTRISKNVVEALGEENNLTKLLETKGIVTKAESKKLYKEFINGSGEAGLEAGQKLLKSLEAQLKANPANLKALESKFAKNTPDNILVSQEAINLARSRGEALAKIIDALQKALLTIDTHHKKVSEDASKALEQVGSGLPSLQKKLETANKISSIIGITESAGFIAGFGKLREELKGTTGAFDKFSLAARGGLGLIGGALTGIVSKIGWAGAIFGTLMEVGTFAARYFGLVTDRSAESSKAIEELEGNVKALHSSMEGLSKATSLEKIFTYNKAAAANALNSINSMVEAVQKLDNLQSNGGALEKLWEKIFKGGQKDLASKSVKGLQDMQNLGLIDEKFLSENLGVTSETRTKSDGEFTLETTEVVSALDVLKEKLATSSEFNAKFSAEIEGLIPKATKLSNAFQEVEIASKDIKKFSKDLVNNLIPQNLGGNLVRSLSSGVSGALEAYNTTGDMSGIVKMTEAMKDSAAIAGVELPNSLTGMITDINKLSEAMKKQGISSDKINEALKAQLSTYSNDTFSSFATSSVQVTKRLFDLADMANQTTINLAKVGAATKIFDYFAGKGLPTAAAEKEKIRLENAAISAQLNPLKKELEILRNTPLEDEPKYRGISVVDTKQAGKLMDIAVEKNDQIGLIQLTSIYQGLVTKELAIRTKSAQIKALEASYINDSVAKSRIANAAMQEGLQTEERKHETKLREIEAEQIALNLKKAMGTSTRQELEYAQRLLDRRKESETLLKDQASLEAQIKNKQADIALDPNKGSKSANEAKLAELKSQLETLKQKIKATSDAFDATESITKTNLAISKLQDNLTIIEASSKVFRDQQDLVPYSIRDQANALGEQKQQYLDILYNLNEQVKLQESLRGEGQDNYTTDKNILDLRSKILSAQKELVEKEKESLETRMKMAELGQGSVTAKDYARAFADETESRVKAMQSSTSVLFKGFFDAANSSIDKLADMMMKGNLNGKDAKEALRESFAQMMRDTIANNLKNSFTNLVSETTKLFSFKSTAELARDQAQQNYYIQTQTYQTSSLSVLQQIATNTSQVPTSRLSTEQYPMSQSPDISKVTARLTRSAATDLNNAATGHQNAADGQTVAAGTQAYAARTNFGAAMENLGASSTFVKGVDNWGNAAFGFLGSLSTMLTASMGGGKASQGRILAMNLLNGAIAGVAKWAGSSVSSSTGVASGASKGLEFDYSGTASGEAISSGVDYSGLQFAKGGVMTDYGPLQLHKYSSGGVATGPQMAIFGEGRKNEAYVPLPDNRSIPVTLSGDSGGTVNNVNVSVTVNNSGNQQGNQQGGGADGSRQFGNMLSKQVTALVQEELIKASRPGGLLYNNNTR